MENVKEISTGLKEKVDAFNPIFHSAANIGEILQLKTEEYKQKAIHALPTTHESDSTAMPLGEKKAKEEGVAADVLELSGLGMRLWHKLKKRR